MRFLFVFSAGVFCLMPAVFGAQAQGKCDEEADQQSMNRCADASFMEVDNLLNDLYAQIQGRLKDDAEVSSALRLSQRSWVSFRNAECAFAASAVKGGSVFPMAYTQCAEGLTQKRVADFEAYLACEEGDVTCPVPAGR